MVPPKSAPSRSQATDPRNDHSDTPATPDPNRELLQQLANSLPPPMLALQLLKLNASSRPPTAPRKTPNLLLLPSFLAKSRNIATSSPSALSPLHVPQHLKQ